MIDPHELSQQPDEIVEYVHDFSNQQLQLYADKTLVNNIGKTSFTVAGTLFSALGVIREEPANILFAGFCAGGYYAVKRIRDRDSNLVLDADYNKSIAVSELTARGFEI